MDPRPYHYEYRRPRLSNPTYQSVNLYQSLYDKGILNRYENNNNIGTFQPKNQFQRQIYEHSILSKKSNQQKKEKQTNTQNFIHPMGRRHSSSMMLDSSGYPSPNRPQSNRSNQSGDQNFKDQRPSVLASYGKHTIPDQKINQINTTVNADSKVFQKLNQFSVYQKQQKPYSIIGNIPRTVSTSLRQYPKFTLENKLIEQGKYLPN